MNSIRIRVALLATICCAACTNDRGESPRPALITFRVEPRPPITNLLPGDTLRLRVWAVGPADTTTMWVSTTPSIVTVTTDGTIRAIKSGVGNVAARLRADTNMYVLVQVRVSDP